MWNFTVMGFTLYEIFYCFFVYSLLGWLMETVLCSVQEGRFINKGFLNGPLCPVYGFGMLIILLFLHRLTVNPALLFAGGLLLATLLECATGFLLETFFHTRWWDYSKKRYNIRGRICPEISLARGVLSVIMVLFVQPLILRMIRLIPTSSGQIGLYILNACIFVDVTSTVLSIHSLNIRLRSMQELRRQLRNHISSITLYSTANEMLKALNLRYDEFISDARIRLAYTPFEHVVLTNDQFKRKFEQLHERYAKLKNHRHEIHKRLIRAFPNMKSKKFSDVLEELKRFI